MFIMKNGKVTPARLTVTPRDEVEPLVLTRSEHSTLADRYAEESHRWDKDEIAHGLSALSEAHRSLAEALGAAKSD